MNSTTLFSVARSLGVTLTVKGASLIAEPLSRIPAELLPRLKEAKPMLMKLLSKPRFGQAPPSDLELSALTVARRWDLGRACIEFAANQVAGPCELCAWVLRREDAYHMAGAGLHESTALACIDLASWQLETDATGLREALLSVGAM
jgi:hypothetical protein